MKNHRVPLHISVADIGTNTIKVTHALVGSDGSIAELEEAAETVRIGKGIEESGRIAEDRIDAAIDVLKDQQRIGGRLGSTVFAGVATEALRIAANGTDLLNRIERETKWDIRVISGNDEARLTWLGLRDRIPVEGRALIIDIGGGSTEIIGAVGDQVAFATSIPLGSGRLADRFFETDPPGEDALDAASSRAMEVLDHVAALPGRTDTVVFSGGNGLFIDQLARQLFPGRALSFDVISALLTHFAKTPASVTAGQIDIAQERARVLPAGAAIALAMLTRVPASAVSAAPSGIRTGLIRQIVGSSNESRVD